MHVFLFLKCVCFLLFFYIFICMRYKYNKEQIEDAVEKSLSIAQVCRIINIKPCGGNYKTLKEKFKIWEIDISHFTGAAWNQGERFRSFSKKYELKDILIENSPYLSTHSLKLRLFKEDIKKEKCEECSLVDWNGKRIGFELDHINGDNKDNRLDNLRILCPNCHSQTPTFRGRGKKKIVKKNKVKIIREKKKYFCPQCQSEYSGKGETCRRCYNEKNRKAKRPPYDQLLQEIEKTSYVAVGRKYGVSDNAIRKWIKAYEKDIKK